VVSKLFLWFRLESTLPRGTFDPKVFETFGLGLDLSIGLPDVRNMKSPGWMPGLFGLSLFLLYRVETYRSARGCCFVAMI
jgi:hypothetical protein